ncbi:MAG: GDP-mannose 4,6-dehydratase [bacterium]
MSYLITGTAGFIGFHVAHVLLERGMEVVGFDNLNDYYSVTLKRDRHAILKKNRNFVAIERDLCEYSCIEEVFKKYKPEKVCHLAAQAGVRYSLINPFAYQKANLEAFLNIIELSKSYGIERFVYASSSSVYGGLQKLPFSEEDRVDTPISLYAATKKSNELIAHCYTHLFKLPTIGLRFFTVYGPWGRPDMAMWIFTESFLKGKPVKIFNYGKMQRDFTYISDIVTGVIASLERDNLDGYELFNLGNHRSENLMDLISIIKQELGKEVKEELLPIQPGDVPATYADIKKAQEKLGFYPETSITQGIPKFIQWYREYHNE